MENKYFIPEIEDIRIGYECEHRICVKETCEWKPFVFEAVLPKEHLHLDKFYRTPYLTKEQIEAEGWKESDVPEFFDRVGNDRWYLSWEPKFNQLTIGDNENKYEFTGEYKDINTLREIQKLLKIK